MNYIPIFRIAVVTAIASQMACVRAENRHHAIIAENLEVQANEWVELGKDQKLKTPGDNNEVCLHPASPFALRDDFSIAAPGGLRILPKVRLVSDGGEYALEHASLTAEALCLGATVGARLNSEYRAVRIWSPAPLSLMRVQWNSSHK